MDPPVAAPQRADRRGVRRPAFGRWAIPAAAAAALVIGVAGLNRVMPPAPVVQAPPQESVAGLTPHTVTPGEQPGSTASDPSGVADQPGSAYTPAVQTPSGPGESTDPTNSSEPVTQPGGSPQGAGNPVDPSVPATAPEQPAPEEQGVPLGPTSPGKGVATVTVGPEVSGQTVAPSRQHLRASLEVTVADPEQAAGELKSQLALAREIREDKRVSFVELQVTVAAEDFAQVIQQLEQLYAAQNATAQLDPVELGGQLDAVAEQIAALQSQRADMAMRLEGETDPKTLEVGALALANFDREIAAHEASYRNLLDSLENGEIQIVLKAQPLR